MCARNRDYVKCLYYIIILLYYTLKNNKFGIFPAILDLHTMSLVLVMFHDPCFCQLTQAETELNLSDLADILKTYQNKDETETVTRQPVTLTMLCELLMSFGNLIQNISSNVYKCLKMMCNKSTSRFYFYNNNQKYNDI